MKNRVILLLAILCVSGLCAVAQVEPQPKPQPQPQPQPQPAIVPAPADVVEIRIDDQNVQTRRGQAQYERAVAVQAAQAAQDARMAWAVKQKTEKGSYIGLGTSPLPTVVRDQLKLPSGSGLVVDRVEANSPAEAAGMKVSDIIQKLDDQTLINPHQFGVLVRNLKPDVEAKLSIIREAKPQTVTIKPVEKDLAPMDEAAAYGAADVWRDANATRTIRYGGGNGTYAITATPKKEKGNEFGDFFTAIDRAEMVIDNGITKITTTTGPKGEQRANVVDKATGKVIYDGAIETPEQRQALPKEVQDQLKELDKMKLEKPMAIKAVRTPQLVFGGGGPNVRGAAPGNNLPKPKSVSGSDDDYTWEFTTKTDENGKPELELLLLDKNGKILFQGPFSRSRDMDKLPAPIAERLRTNPWYSMIEDLKGTGGGNVLNLKLAAPGQPAAPAAGGPAVPGAAPGGADNNFVPTPKNKPAK